MTGPIKPELTFEQLGALWRLSDGEAVDGDAVAWLEKQGLATWALLGAWGCPEDAIGGHVGREYLPAVSDVGAEHLAAVAEAISVRVSAKAGVSIPAETIVLFEWDRVLELIVFAHMGEVIGLKAPGWLPEKAGEDGVAPAEPKPEPKYCQAAKDGDCDWPGCPQERDGEPGRSGRSCPMPDYPELD